MKTYTFVEKFGHGRAAARTARVDELDITDDDGWTFRLQVNPGRTKEQVAREFLSLCDFGSEALALCADGGSYWLEKTDPDLWVESGGEFTYRLADHPHAIAHQ